MPFIPLRLEFRHQQVELPAEVGSNVRELDVTALKAGRCLFTLCGEKASQAVKTVVIE